MNVGRDNLDRWRADLDRVTDAPQRQPPLERLLVQITGATLMPSATKRYAYDWSEAEFTVTTTPSYSVAPAVKSGGLTGKAVSVSELSNDAVGRYSYGVDPANLPSGFDAVAIPTGTYVVIVPHRGSDGVLTWLILNTQAIDGTCT